MYCTEELFLFLLGQNILNLVVLAMGRGGRAFVFFPAHCSITISLHTQKKYIKMKENYYSILEYISMFELMDREYYTSIFFEEQGIRSLQVIPRYVLAACPGKSPRNISGITLNNLPHQISRRKRHFIYNNNHHMK